MSAVLRVKIEPPAHFEVAEWDVADAFDDFLSEEIGIEYSVEFVENEGEFVARRFFPLNELGQDEMNQIVLRFMKQTRMQSE